MVEYIQGDLLETKAPLILHQVNLHRAMGGGLAYSIAKKYPTVEYKYRVYQGFLGEVLYCQTKDFIVGNCYSQNEDFTTNYDMLTKCLINVRNYMTQRGIDTVAIPYKYGCGIAKGDWATVELLFKAVLGDFNILIYI